MKRQQNTTIQVSTGTKKALDSAKKYRRETYNDVIMRILEETRTAEKKPKERSYHARAVDADAQEKRREKTFSPAELEY